MRKLKQVTVHGRFQPPLHVNHWNYIKAALDQADRVTILITNPYLDEGFESTASWRSDPANNPFSYEERVQLFKDFFLQMGISPDRYNFEPFNIKEAKSFSSLDKAVPNVVNVYSEWSEKKLDTFGKHGLLTLRLDQPKLLGVSGTKVRELIKRYSANPDKLCKELIKVGYMLEAVPGLMKLLEERPVRLQ